MKEQVLVPLTLSGDQQQSIVVIFQNQARIDNALNGAILLAADSGTRLLKLKDEIQKKFGRVWKVWVQTEGNLPVGYEQVTRYIKLARNKDLLNEIDSKSIEDAVRQIEHKLRPEKAEAAAKREVEKAEVSFDFGLRIAPTANPGSFFIMEQEKAAGKWGNAKGSHAIPVYINDKTTVFDLMDIISGTRT